MELRRFEDAPVLDFRDYAEGTLAQKNTFVDGMDASFRAFGNVKLANTYFDRKLSAKLFRLNEKFFEGLSAADKQRYNLRCRGQRGYTGFGVEGARDRSVGDLKEMLMWGQDGIGEPDNMNPPEVPGLRDASMEAYWTIERQNSILYRAVAHAHDIDPAYYEWDWMDGRFPNSSLRSIYYGPVTRDMIAQLCREAGTQEMPMRSGKHTDINRFTWLYLADSSEGLELQLTNGEWVPATVSSDIALVNNSDISSTELDGVYPSLVHRVRVINPEAKRLSIPCFTHPAKGKCLKRLVTNPHAPGERYRATFAEVYGQDVLEALPDDVRENLGLGTLRVRYDHFLENRLAEIGVYSDDEDLKRRILASFKGRAPPLCEKEMWEQQLPLFPR